MPEPPDTLDMLVLSERIDASNEVLEQSLHAFLDIISSLDKLETKILIPDKINHLGDILSKLVDLTSQAEKTLQYTDKVYENIDNIRKMLESIKQNSLSEKVVSDISVTKDTVVAMKTSHDSMKKSHDNFVLATKIIVSVITSILLILGYLVQFGFLPPVHKF